MGNFQPVLTAVTPVRVALGIFFPQQPFGYMRPFQFLVNCRPVRNLIAPAAAGIGTGINSWANRVSSSAAGSGQPRCRAWARLSSFWIPPTLSLVLRLMSRMDRPAACRSRSTSRSLRIVILLPGMVGSSKKERACQRVTSSMH